MAPYTICGVCSVAILDLPTVIEEHRQLRHAGLLDKKGHQFWCDHCEKWLARPQDKRHYQNVHPTIPIPPRHQAFVVDPATFTVVTGKRAKGPKSKFYHEQRSDSSDTEDSSALSSLDSDDDEISAATQPPPSKRRKLAQPPAPRPSAISLPIRPTPQESLVERQRKIQQDAVARTNVQIQARQEAVNEELDRRLQDPDGYQTCVALEEFSFFVNKWEQRVDPSLITAAQYTHLYQAHQLTPELNPYVVVVCTMAEARTLLELGAPLRYILVPDGGIPSSTLSRPSMLAEMSAKAAVDVQELDQPIELTGGGATTKSGPEAVELFNSDALINLLNLCSAKDAPYPPCIADLAAYDILQRLRDSNIAGKETVGKLNDLTSCATFHVCANRNVWHVPHQDHYGLITTLFVEWGLKLWLAWPQMSESQRQVWADEGMDAYPEEFPFPILLQSGNLLIQPSMSVHAPYTVEDCLISGTQHFHSPSMDQHMAAALFERRNTHVTNEEESQESVAKFCLILQQMLKDNPRWPWPSTEAKAIYKSRLQVRF